MTGFALTHRTVFDHPLFDGDAARLGAWLWLVGKACWKPTPFDISGRIVTLDRGQICASRAQLSKAWGMSPSAVERFLTRLETEQMIGRATGQGRSIITICNYDKYQASSEGAGQATGQATGQRPDSDRTAKEQGNKETREEDTDVSSPPTPKHARKRDWPEIPDWVPIEPWNAFVEMREKKRAALTPRAVKLTLKELERWMTSGQDPGAILDQSTQRSWTGIFELKDDNRGTGNRTGQPTGNSGDGLSRATKRWANLGDAEDAPGEPERSPVRTGQGHSQGTLALPGPAHG